MLLIFLLLLPSDHRSGVGTYLSGTARAVPLLKVGRLVMHFAVSLFGHRLQIALMIDVSFIVTSQKTH